MKTLLCLIQPWDIATAARTDIRVGDGLSADAFGLGGETWLAGMQERPQISVETMSLDLDGRVQAGRMTIVLTGDFIFQNLKWSGAPITLWSAPDLAYVARKTEFTGEVRTVALDLEEKTLRLSCEVSVRALDTDMLTLEFAGGGGLTGEAEMRGTLKPAGFGLVENIEPVWFDKTNWVGMIDGYGNTLAITRLMEGASDFGASVGDYADYDALVAAIVDKTIAPGRWGTCIAEGLIGLGAPPHYPIGANAQFGSDRLGAIARRILEAHAGIDVADIDTAAFDALDTALPYAAHLWVKEQRNVREMIEALAASGNATPIVTPQGLITISRGVKTAAVATLDRSGSVTPRVTNWKSATPVPPWWKIKARTARPANVLTFDQVLYSDDIVDRGAYSATEVYRAGHLVWLGDKSSWLYTNDVAAAGNAPPTWPETTNDHWRNLSPPADTTLLAYADGTPIEDLKPGDSDATRNVPGQKLQDAIFSPEWWTLSAQGTRILLADAPRGYALEILPLDGVVAYSEYGGTEGAAVEVEPGRKIWTRFIADPSKSGASNVASGSNNVTSGNDNVVADTNVAADWPLVVRLNWAKADGTPISSTSIASVATAGGQQELTVVALPPAEARLVTVGFGHEDDLAGAAGSWVVWSPWIGEHQPASDITSENAPKVVGPGTQQITLKADGSAEQGQLPRDLVYQRFVGDLDVSQLAEWTATFNGITGTIDNSPSSGTRGEVEVTAIAGTKGSVIVSAAYDGVSESKTTEFTTKELQAGTGSGSAGSGVTQTTLSVSATVSASSYGAASASAVLDVTNGNITATGLLSYTTPDGTAIIAGKWRYSPQGAGTWTDFGAEKTGTEASSTYDDRYAESFDTEGSINMAQSVTGLAAGEYDVEFLPRKSSGTAVNAYLYGNLNLQAD